jgi:hypothetical protein
MEPRAHPNSAPTNTAILNSRNLDCLHVDDSPETSKLPQQVTCSQLKPDAISLTVSRNTN